MSEPSLRDLQTRVLEANGRIEERAAYPDFRKFVVQYVFTRESLERFIELTKQERQDERA
jgi:hypothetical protein